MVYTKTIIHLDVGYYWWILTAVKTFNNEHRYEDDVNSIVGISAIQISGEVGKHGYKARVRDLLMTAVSSNLDHFHVVL